MLISNTFASFFCSNNISAYNQTVEDYWEYSLPMPWSDVDLSYPSIYDESYDSLDDFIFLEEEEEDYYTEEEEENDKEDEIGKEEPEETKETKQEEIINQSKEKEEDNDSMQRRTDGVDKSLGTYDRKKFFEDIDYYFEKDVNTEENQEFLENDLRYSSAFNDQPSRLENSKSHKKKEKEVNEFFDEDLE